MKTFNELMTEGTVSISVDFVGDTTELKQFIDAGKKFKAKKGPRSPNGDDTVTLSGDRKQLLNWLRDNYDDSLDDSDMDAFIV